MKAKDFPPLKRTLNQFIKAKTDFYGYFLEETLSGAVEIKADTDSIHIQSLVVDPDYFRRGIASLLMQFILTKYKDNHLTVETGLANKPAITLYEKNGFKQTKQFNTSHGIRKIRLEKSIDNS